MSADDRRFFPHARQVTGDPMRFLAYVMDRATGRPVCTCPHRHVSRLRQGGKNGGYYAMRCAEKMTRKWVADHVTESP